jgi:hypothetical protein
MALTTAQEKIVDAIYEITDLQPFCTPSEIADHLDISPNAVRNQIDDVVDERADIELRRVGQGITLYPRPSYVEEIAERENVKFVGELPASFGAAYYSLNEPPEDSEFDFLAVWYDSRGNVKDDYVPEPEEIGEVAEWFAHEPVAVRYCTKLAREKAELEARESPTRT